MVRIDETRIDKISDACSVTLKINSIMILENATRWRCINGVIYLDLLLYFIDILMSFNNARLIFFYEKSFCSAQGHLKGRI